MKYFSKYDKEALLCIGRNQSFTDFKSSIDSNDGEHINYVEMSVGKYDELLSYIKHVIVDPINSSFLTIDEIDMNNNLLAFVASTREADGNESKLLIFEYISQYLSDNNKKENKTYENEIPLFFKEEKDGKLVGLGCTYNLEDYKKEHSNLTITEMKYNEFYSFFFNYPLIKFSDKCGKEYKTNTPKTYYKRIEEGVEQGFGTITIDDMSITKESYECTFLELSKHEFDCMNQGGIVPDDGHLYDVIY